MLKACKALSKQDSQRVYDAMEKACELKDNYPWPCHRDPVMEVRMAFPGNPVAKAVLFHDLLSTLFDMLYCSFKPCRDSSRLVEPASLQNRVIQIDPPDEPGRGRNSDDTFSV
jgi:hypothetical protein